MELSITSSQGGRNLCADWRSSQTSMARQADEAPHAPPNHRDDVVHATDADAEADKEHFKGKTTD